MSEQEQLALTLPRARVRLGDADPDAALPRTGWEVNAPPPSAGWWEVTDHATGTMRERWWFDPGYGGWWTGARVVTSAEFHKEHAWRGLAEPHPGGYTYSMRANWPIQAMAQAITAHASDDFAVVPRGDDFDVVRPRARVRL